jgi:hypothetical protein
MRWDSGLITLLDTDVVLRKKKNFFDSGRRHGIEAQMITRSHSIHVQIQTE